MSIDLILYLLAFVFFVLKALNVSAGGRIDFQNAGFAALTLTLIV